MDKIYQSDFYSFSKDKITQGKFEAKAVSATLLTSNYKQVNDLVLCADKLKLTKGKSDQEPKKAAAVPCWQLTRDISAFPQYQSDFPMMDVLYNMALEEMENAVEPDRTFRTGKEWAGVWTRDISYSIILSMAILHPEVAENSLLKKVKNNRIVQDTGTGGSWPVSSDRMIWSIAAWEVYKTTGDEKWLVKVYQIIKNSITDDLKNLYNDQTGLVKGESSFLDWREQTYPKWMQPADIYSSENLGTNVIHYQANKVLSQMAARLNEQDTAKVHAKIAEQIKEGINTYLWLPEKGYYGQYLYGRQFPVLSPRSEALGEALAVLFDLADTERQKTIVAHTPVTNFGIPCIYPQIPGIPPYHNDAVWPFVQSFWSLAAAKTGNVTALVQSMSAVYRPAALFLTNKENFASSTGDFAGTQINSSNMLWSLAGNISMLYKVIFGMEFQEDALVFKPVVPRVFKGKRVLNNFKYRKAILNITLSGHGNTVRSITLDGEKLSAAVISAKLSGRHDLVIVLADNKIEEGKTGLVKDCFSLAAPVAKQQDSRTLSWDKVEGAVEYEVFHHGKLVIKTTGLSYAASKTGEYQVMATDQQGVPSFASEPVQFITPKKIQKIYLTTVAKKSNLPYQGYKGEAFIEISKTKNTDLTLKVLIPKTGTYAIDFRYANGNGPVSTENKCAVRTFMLDGQFSGTFVFPQRGKGEWSNWGFSNTQMVILTKGTHEFNLSLQEWNENMNGEVNQAMLNYLRLISVS